VPIGPLCLKIDSGQYVRYQIEGDLVGRRTTAPKLENHVKEARLNAGLSQQELADRTGLTRQAVNSIEAGRYLPNTAVSLQLARALDTTVERLFTLDAPTGVTPSVALPDGVRHGDRVVVGRVGARLVAHPVAAPATSDGFASADGVVVDDANIRLLVPAAQVEKTAFLVGCDPSLEMLATLVTRRARGSARLLWVPGSSKDAIDALANASAHIGGIHLREEASGEFNVPQATRALERSGGMLIAYADWEQGFVLRSGNPRKLSGADSLAGRGVRIVNREPGAGSRLLLDSMLSAACIDPARIAGYDHVVRSHMAVARAVAGGTADTGIAIRAVASALELDFLPLMHARFDLVIPATHLDHPAIDLLLEVLQAAALRAELGALPGYGTAETGAVRATVAV